MRLSYILGELGNGGQERQLFYLIKELKKGGHEVLLIVWSIDKNAKYFYQLNDLGIEYVALNKEQSVIEKIILSRKAIRKFNPSILHSFTFYLNFFTWLIALFTKTKAIGGIRSQLNSYKLSTGSLVTILSSVFPKNKISNNYKFNEDYSIAPINKLIQKNTYIVTNHLDISKFKPYYFETENEVRTASIGRLYEEKRIDLMIEVIAALVKQGINIKHYHAGRGDLFDSLDEKVKSNNLQDHFIFCGEVNDVSEFLSDKTFFIHTSDFEGFPNVIMEAMSCGKAIVSTDAGDTSFLVKDGVNGFIVSCGDMKTFVEKCIYLTQNPKLIIEMGKEGRKIAEENFKLEHLMTNTLGIYNKLCAE